MLPRSDLQRFSLGVGLPKRLRLRGGAVGQDTQHLVGSRICLLCFSIRMVHSSFFPHHGPLPVGEKGPLAVGEGRESKAPQSYSELL